ncbi:hypothetical protein, partial [Paenirhodobacter ferrireducens]|uniref:hypothetical protein n=1 Tax=Paenirhodobacter ferrireducens TaxID=1215032 RepID=UPI0019D269BA
MCVPGGFCPELRLVDFVRGKSCPKKRHDLHREKFFFSGSKMDCEENKLPASQSVTAQAEAERRRP